ncbi:MAG TPA: hypothetical protein VND91_03390 [Candidatus Saccharimonadia bacterium]|nr:hypothetical protein [Candidatus Saccharimonadia bacterium]
MMSTARAAPADSGLGAWRDYAARGLTPDFSWADKPAVEAVRPTVIDTAFAPRAGSMSFAFAGGDLSLGLTISRSRATDAVDASGRFEPQRLTRAGIGLERTFISPSLTHALDDRTSVTAGVVLADQRFATMGLGSSVFNEFAPSSLPAGISESSFGTGVRVALDQRIGDSLSLTSSFQSKIDMDAMQSYRGVYGGPGDFDVPAIASAGLAWSPLPAHTIDLDVQRVLYSDVSAFASASLPTRMLQALGDSDSPVFAWRDLTIYGVSWTWRATPTDAFRLRYSTQQQPEPTDALLRETLSNGFTDDNFALAYVHDFGRVGTLEFAASYARSPYFMGNWSRPNRDLYGDQIEVEAIWSVDF